MVIGRAAGLVSLEVGGLVGLTSCGWVRFMCSFIDVGLVILRLVALVLDGLVGLGRLMLLGVVGWLVRSGLLFGYVELLCWCCVSWLVGWLGSSGWVVGWLGSSDLFVVCVGLVCWYCVAWLGALVFVGLGIVGLDLDFGGFGSSI